MSADRPSAAGTEPLQVVGAAILDGHRLLAAQRAESSANGLLWELPGGKIEPGESPRQALRREIAEELGVEVDIGPLLGHGSASTSHLEISLAVYQAAIVHGEPTAREHRQLRWITSAELADLDWTVADRPLLPTLRNLLKAGLQPK